MEASDAWRHCGWENERISWNCCFFFYFLFFIKAWLAFASNLRQGNPSSSSPRLLFMYVKVPDPTPETGWSNIAFLHIFVQPVADVLYRRR